MKRLAALILWTFLFFALLLGVDQLFLRVPLQVAGFREVRTFYVDFRSRLFSWRPTVTIKPPPLPTTPVRKGEKTVEKEKTRSPSPKTAPQRFLFVDETGSLQFADSLEEVPARFRKEARAMAP